MPLLPLLVHVCSVRVYSDCAVDVRSSKRVKRDTDSHSADETKAERRQRIETAQQEAIAHQQQQLLATTPDEPVPVPVQSVQQPVGAEEPTGQENVPPPMAVKSKAGKAGKGKGRAVRKGKKASADGTDESEAESAVAVSDVDPPTTASERDDDEGETAKRTRTTACQGGGQPHRLRCQARQEGVTNACHQEGDGR